MTAPMPNSDLVPRVPLIASEIPNLRGMPLHQLADLAEKTLRRIVSAVDAAKPPVATFDASL